MTVDLFCGLIVHSIQDKECIFRKYLLCLFTNHPSKPEQYNIILTIIHWYNNDFVFLREGNLPREGNLASMFKIIEEILRMVFRYRGSRRVFIDRSTKYQVKIIRACRHPTRIRARGAWKLQIWMRPQTMDAAASMGAANRAAARDGIFNSSKGKGRANCAGGRK